MLKLPFAPVARAFVALTGALNAPGVHAAQEAARPAPLPIVSSQDALQTLNTFPQLATDGLDFGDTAFTRAVAELEQCRNAQARAERRAARGALSRKALENFRDATRKAQSLVDKLRGLRATRSLADAVTIVVDGGGINTFSPLTTSSSRVQPASATARNPDINAPRTAHVTPPNVKVSVSATPAAQGTGIALAARPPSEALTPPVGQTLAPGPVLAAAPLLARPESPHGDGSISAPPLENRTALKSPPKAGVRVPLTPVASLPGAFVRPKMAEPATQISAPPLAMTPKVMPAPVADSTEVRQAPNLVKPAPDTQKEARTRLAQLEAQLNHAEKRLNAADAALSEGQIQLTKFAGTLRQAMLEAGPEATGLHPFVKISEKYAGTPYVWGGESRGGFDCSGLIILVMRELGYKTPPHSAAEQFKYGVPIAQPLLKPGDLVFFSNTYKPGISHVGIYLGKRRFIHAAGTGKGTIVSSLDNPHFQEKYAGGRRLVQVR